MSLAPLVMHISSSGGVTTGKAVTIVHHVDCGRTRVNRKNDNDMRGQLYHDVLRLQGHLPRVAGVPAIVS